MATFKPGPLVANIAGSIGGLTFQRQAGAPQVRSKPRPAYRTNRYTVKPRSGMQQVSQLWRTLSSAQRLEWASKSGDLTWYNRFGDPYKPSGYAYFTRCNLVLSSAEQALLTDAPDNPTLAVLGAADVYFEDDKITASWPELGTVPADYLLQIEVTPPCSPAVTNRRSSFVFLALYGEGIGPSVELKVPYVTRFGGVPNIGWALFGRMRLLHIPSGWTTAWQEYQAIRTS